MSSTAVQHSAEVVGTAAVFDDFAVDHAAELGAVAWETVDAEMMCSVLLADTAACNDVDVGAAVVLECTGDTVAPVVLDCTAVDIVQGAPVFVALGDTVAVFGYTADCCCGVGTAFAVACWFGRSAL